MLTAVLLASDREKVGRYVGKMQETVTRTGEALLSAVTLHTEERARALNVEPVAPRLGELEEKAEELESAARAMEDASPKELEELERAKAEAEGLRVVDPATACAEADVIMVLVPDPAQRGLGGADRGGLASRKVDQLDVLKTDPLQRVQVDECRAQPDPLLHQPGHQLAGLVFERVAHDKQDVSAGILGRLAAWHEDVPCVVHTIHGLAFHPYQSKLKNAIYIASERFAARRCHRIIGVADAMRALEEGRVRGKVSVRVPA